VKKAHPLALAAVLAAESVLFLVMTGRHSAWVYPRWYDQLQYLGQAYDGYEYMRLHGFAAAAWHTLTLHPAQGSLHAFFALLVFAAAGPSRGAALAVNLLAFLALQGATFFAVRRISGSFPLALAAVALLASVRFPWSVGPACAVDFRLDWMAACAYGVALAAAVAADGFRSTRRAVLFGAAAGVVILIRHLTAVYFSLIFVALMSWLLARADRRAGCGRLGLAALTAAALSAPELWFSRKAIYGYYWLDQLVGAERGLRGSHLGFAGSAGWLLREALYHQIGLAAAALGLGAAAALLVLRLAPVKSRGPSGAPSPPLGSSWAVALAFLCAPAAVLVLYPVNAPQTLSTLIPGLVWVVVLAWIHAARGAGRAAVGAVCAGVIVAGALLFARAEAAQAPSPEKEAEFRAINGLDDYVYFRAEESGLRQPGVAVTWHLDGLNARAFRIVGFERHHRLLPFIQTLPADQNAAEKGFIMERLAASDFVFLVTRAGANFAFDHQMEAMAGEMRLWCDANLAHAGDLETVGLSVSVYERPGLARPRGGGVVLSEMLGAAARGPASSGAVPPGAPLFVSPARALGCSGAEFRYDMAAAYSPVRYGADALPAGLHLNPETGEIRGLLPRAGDRSVWIAAANPAGRTRAKLAIHIEDARMYSVLDAPAACAAGAQVEIGYGAFDADGRLDFVDFTDLTEGKALARVPAPEGAKRSWEGVFRVAFSRPGAHSILLRTVCFEPSGKERYVFVDRVCEISVAP